MISPKRILFVSKGEASASTRYRALQFFPLLTAAGYLPEHATVSGGLRRFCDALRRARKADIVVVLRRTFPGPLLWLMRRASRKLVFDLDDAIFCNSDGSSSPTRVKRFKAIAKASDHIFAGNRFLADRCGQLNTSVDVLPTCLDPRKYAISAEQPQDHIDLVWIGSQSTRKYLIDALPALTVAAQELPNLRLKIIADFDLEQPPIPTVAVPWNADTEALELASSHIGIAPMRDDDWSRGKCALKVLQYMAAGLPVVSSNAGVNADAVRHGETGYLVETEQQWAQAIHALATDAPLRTRMGQAGRLRVGQHYSIEAVFETMRPTLERLS